MSGTRTRDPGRLGQLSVRVVAYRYPGEIWDLSLPSYLPLSVVAERGVATSPSRPARFRSGERGPWLSARTRRVAASPRLDTGESLVHRSD